MMSRIIYLKAKKNLKKLMFSNGILDKKELFFYSVTAHQKSLRKYGTNYEWIQCEYFQKIF